MPEEHRAKLSDASKRRRVASTGCLAFDVQVGGRSSPFVAQAEVAPAVAPVDYDMESFVSGLDLAGYASAGPPQIKPLQGRGLGRGRGGFQGPALQVQDEDLLAASDGQVAGAED